MAEQNTQHLKTELLHTLTESYHHTLEANLRNCMQIIFDQWQRFPNPQLIETITSDWITSRIIKNDEPVTTPMSEVGMTTVDFEDSCRTIFFSTLDAIHRYNIRYETDGLTQPEIQNNWQTFMRKSISEKGGVWSSLAGKFQLDVWMNKPVHHQPDTSSHSRN